METLEIKYRDNNIADVLDMTVSEAIKFFSEDDENKYARKITDKLLPLEKVGMGYVKLGQSSSTLSGGEAQRTKLAAFLARGGKDPHTLFIFDEPTTGLHFHDVAKLLKSFTELLNRGHSLIVIEHNLDIIKCADWILDLGPHGGLNGGELVFEGTPEKLLESKDSLTGKYLRPKFGVGS
jgi:excinuclease ABC subunit A